MNKLYVCEYPYVLYKTLIERMGDDQNSYSLILSDAWGADLSSMVPVLRQSGLFDRVEFFPSAPYRDYYDLGQFDFPTSAVGKAFSLLKSQLKISLRQKDLRSIDFPFNIDFKQYDKIICTDGQYVLNGHLSMNHIEYAIFSHSKHAHAHGFVSIQACSYFLILRILDKLHILNGSWAVSRFCKEIIVDDFEKMAIYLYGKKITVWNVNKHIDGLDAQQKDRIFQLYADAFGVKISAGQPYDLLLTNPLYSDAYLPSEKKQIEFYKDIIRDRFKNPVLIKPHPRDTVDYKKFFPECIVIDQNISSEVLNFSQNLKLGTVLTLFSTSASSFQEKAEKVIALEDYKTPAGQMESLKAYR